MEIFSWTITLLMQWYVWLPLVILLSFLTWRNYQQLNEFISSDNVLLILEIPKTNDKKELAAEQLFASLHGILRDKRELKLSRGAQEHLSFEVASVNGQIRFYVWTASSRGKSTPNIQPSNFTRLVKIIPSTNVIIQ